MIILSALSFLGGIIGFILITLSIASGLYYVSEFVEEHSVFSKRLITYAIYVVCAILALSLFDGMPWYLVALDIASHVIYYSNLKTFPVISLTSGRFISACVLVFVNHYLWFRHFGDMQYRRITITFGQVASFFGVCVWFVPFALFVSLTAADNVLPTSGSSAPSTPNPNLDGFVGISSRTYRGGGLVKKTYSWIGERVQPILQTLGIVTGDDEVLISQRRYA